MWFEYHNRGIYVHVSYLEQLVRYAIRMMQSVRYKKKNDFVHIFQTKDIDPMDPYITNCDSQYIACPSVLLLYNANRIMR